MSDELADMYITMRANMDPYNRELRSGEATGDHFESHAHGIFSSVGSAVIGLATVVGGAAIFKSIYDEAIEAQKVTAQTNAVLASTGNAAHVSAGQVSELAMALSNKTAIDDEVIQSGANLLLTFTNVRNEAGKGNDIFNQATSTILDMSAALGQDTSASAIQLGKALNDPIAGVTALRRVGVQLSDQQKEQIKLFMAHNDILGAQKIILGELTKEFGGSAAAVATPMERLGVVIKNLEETIGTALLPILAVAADWLSAGLPVALDYASRVFGRVEDVVVSFYNALRTGFTEDEGTPVELFALRVRDVFFQVRDVVLDVWARISPALTQISDFIGDHLQPILISLGAVAGVLAGSAAIGALISALAVLVGAIASPAVAVAALIAGLVYAYQESETFRNIVDGVVSWLVDNVPPAFFAVRDAAMVAFKWIQDNVIPVVQRVVAYITVQVQHLAEWWRQHWQQIHDAVRNYLTIIGAVIYGAVQYVLFIWNHFGDQIMAVVQFAWDSVKNIIDLAVRVIGDIISLFTNLLSGNWGAAWDDIKDILAAAWEFMKNSVSNSLGFIVSFFASLPGNIVSAMGDLLGLLVGKGVEIIGGLWNGISDRWTDVWNWFIGLGQTIIDNIPNPLDMLHHVGEIIMDGLKAGLQAGWEHVKDFLGSLNPASYKGPPARDAMMLYGAGQLIMGGLHRGLQDQWSHTASWLSGLNPTIGATSVPNIAARFTSGAGSLTALAVGTTVTHEHRVTITHEGEIKHSGTAMDADALAKQLVNPMRKELNDLPVSSLFGGKA